MGSPPCREDFRRTRQPSRPGHSPDGHQTCARWQQGQDVVERGELSLPQPESHALRSEEHTSELQSRFDLVCRLLLEKKKKKKKQKSITYHNPSHHYPITLHTYTSLSFIHSSN